MHHKRRKPPKLYGKRTYFSGHYLQFPATSTRYLEISDDRKILACMQKKKFMGIGGKKKYSLFTGPNYSNKWQQRK
ncbi:hypothetical protein DsansV1_C22g0172131 [Dioscorea sansibarensis]